MLCPRQLLLWFFSFIDFKKIYNPKHNLQLRASNNIFICNVQKFLKGTAGFSAVFFFFFLIGGAELYPLIIQLPRNRVKPTPNFSAVDRLDLLRTLVKYSTRELSSSTKSLLCQCCEGSRGLET